MRIAVVYTTRRGNTAKVAAAIAGALGVEAKRPAEMGDVGPLDLLLVGSGVYYGRTNEDLERFLTGLPKGSVRCAAVFGTYGAHHLAAIQQMKDLLFERGIPILDTFYCYGHFYFFRLRHPDARDLQRAREFALHVRARAEA
ncbi:MAG: flavodoxin family protein [Patescibacteria group bacterium]